VNAFKKIINIDLCCNSSINVYNGTVEYIELFNLRKFIVTIPVRKPLMERIFVKSG